MENSIWICAISVEDSFHWHLNPLASLSIWFIVQRAFFLHACDCHWLLLHRNTCQFNLIPFVSSRCPLRVHQGHTAIVNSLENLRPFQSSKQQQTNWASSSCIVSTCSRVLVFRFFFLPCRLASDGHAQLLLGRDFSFLPPFHSRMPLPSHSPSFSPCHISPHRPWCFFFFPPPAPKPPFQHLPVWLASFW